MQRYAEKSQFHCDWDESAGSPIPGREIVWFFLYDDDVRIGKGAVEFRARQGIKTAVLCDMDITEDYRGQHLADLIYEAGTRYVLEHTGCNQLIVEIEEDNSRSRRAAERNGFRWVDCLCDDGLEINILAKDISSLRQVKPKLDERHPSL